MGSDSSPTRSKSPEATGWLTTAWGMRCSRRARFGRPAGISRKLFDSIPATLTANTTSASPWLSREGWRTPRRTSGRRFASSPTTRTRNSTWGNALARQGEDAEAIAYLRQAARDDPGSAATHAGMGTALLNVGRFEEAVTSLSEAVRVKPDFAVAHYNLARALVLQGKSSAASDHYARAFPRDPALRAQAERRQKP